MSTTFAEYDQTIRRLARERAELDRAPFDTPSYAAALDRVAILVARAAVLRRQLRARA